jgi:pimeloyl-ACP methyl ester carboxylesterase
MTFDEVLEQAIEMLRRRGRGSYRALKRQFALDDAYLEDRKAEMITIHRLATDQHGEILVWIGAPTSAPLPEASVREQEREPLSYTPKHLTEKILDLQVPTLVMHGTVDRRVPCTAGQSMAQHIPGAQFYAFGAKDTWRCALRQCTSSAKCCATLSAPAGCRNAEKPGGIDIRQEKAR